MSSIPSARYCRACGGRLARDQTETTCTPCRAKTAAAAEGPPEVGSGFWETDLMRDALATRHMGRVIRAYRQHPHHGRLLSQELVAGWLGISQAQLSRIEHGPPIMDLDRLIYWARLLKIPAGLLWFDLPEERRRQAHRPPVAAAGVEPASSVVMFPAALPTRAFGNSADAVAAEAFRAADLAIGGGHLYASVVRYLQAEVGPRLFGASGDDGGPQLFRAAAGLTDLAGWMAHDAGNHGLARQHFDRAVGLAAMGGDHQLSAHVLSSLSNLAHHLGEPREAAVFARAGREKLSKGPQNPALAARLLAMEARSVATLGEAAECARILLRAEQTLGVTPTAEASPWVGFFDEGSLAADAARCLRQLNDLKAARRQAERVVVLRPREWRRSRAFGQLALANVLVEQGELEEACALGYEIVDGTQALGSLLVVQQLQDLYRLLEPYRSVAVVVEFLAYLGAALHARAWLSQMPDVVSGGQTIETVGTAEGTH